MSKITMGIPLFIELYIRAILLSWNFWWAKELTDIYAVNNNGDTLIHAATQDSSTPYYIDIIKFLVTKGAEVNTKNNNGDTPLHLAAKQNAEFIIPTLLAKGANINAKNNAGQTPAMMTDDAEIKKLLMKK